MYEIYQKLRDERGLKDSDVAREASVSKSTFSDWKVGRSKPGIKKLQKIADFFGVTVDYLMTGKEDEQKEKDNTGDLKQKFEELKELLESGKMQPLRYDGQPIDDNTKELLLKQVEISMAMMKK
jgi:transcriptional regulator with XRE-family HTH domain